MLQRNTKHIYCLFSEVYIRIRSWIQYISSSHFFVYYFRNYLAPAEMQTLHEVMYFNAANTLREHLNATPRAALHTALNKPYFYLKVGNKKKASLVASFLTRVPISGVFFVKTTFFIGINMSKSHSIQLLEMLLDKLNSQWDTVLRYNLVLWYVDVHVV